MSSGAGGVCLAGGVPQFVLGCGIDSLGEATIVVGVPASSRQVADINSKPPISDNISQLDAIPLRSFPVSTMVMVQVDKPNPSVNLP